MTCTFNLFECLPLMLNTVFSLDEALDCEEDNNSFEYENNEVLSKCTCIVLFIHSLSIPAVLYMVTWVDQGTHHLKSLGEGRKHPGQVATALQRHK